MQELDSSEVKKWLLKESPEPIQYPNSPDVFIDWLLEENWLDTQPLCDRLWEKTQFPSSVMQRLISA